MARVRLASITLPVLFFSTPLWMLAQGAPQPVPQSSGTQNAINGIDSYPSTSLVNYAKKNDPQSRRIDMCWR